MAPFVLFVVGKAFGLSGHLIEFLRGAAASISQTLMLMRRVWGPVGVEGGTGLLGPFSVSQQPFSTA